MKNKEKSISIMMATIMSAAMGFIFPLLARANASAEALKSMPPAIIMYLESILESIVIGIVLVLLFPLGLLGRKLASKFNANPPSPRFILLNCLPISAISAIVVSGICSFTSIAISHSKIPAKEAPPLMAMWFPSWIRALPIMIIVSYILSIVLSPIIVKTIMGKNNSSNSAK